MSKSKPEIHYAGRFAAKEAVIKALKSSGYKPSIPFNSIEILSSNSGEPIVKLNSTINESGITIFSVGLGSVKGAPIPIKENNIVKSYKKDENGEVVITRLDENLPVSYTHLTLPTSDLV